MQLRSSKPEARWTRRKDARPAELLAAALELFVARGYAATRLDDVAKQAGVSKGTLYLYFSSKEELFKAVIREGLVPRLVEGERMLETHTGTAEALLRELIKTWWRAVGETSLGGIPKLMVAEAGNFPELAKFYYDEVISRGRKLVSGVLTLGIQRGEFRQVDTDLLVRLFMAPPMLMAIYRYSFDACDQSQVEPERYLDLHVDMFMNGLLKQTKTSTVRRKK